VHVARERVLDAEVEDHFERSQRVLTEVTKLDASTPVVLTRDRDRAADLVAAGRVYRRTADALGETATSELLEDLERVLLDVANGSPQPTAAEIEALRNRIDQQDLVFRLRVVGAELRHKQGTGATPAY
jgi:maltooligosyltrehalose synthase